MIFYVYLQCLILFYTVCSIGTEHHDCSWNLSCSDVTGVRRCKDQSPCTSGCFCSNETVLKDGVCSGLSSCTGMSLYLCTYLQYYHYLHVYMLSWNTYLPYSYVLRSKYLWSRSSLVFAIHKYFMKICTWF